MTGKLYQRTGSWERFRETGESEWIELKPKGGLKMAEGKFALAMENDLGEKIKNPQKILKAWAGMLDDLLDRLEKLENFMEDYGD